MTPALIIVPFLLLAAFGISFTFHGGHDVTYAPAVFLVMIAGLACILPGLKNGFQLPRGASVWLTLAFWGYLSVSLIWTTVPFASLITWLNLTVLPLILISLLCAPRRDLLIKHCMLALVAGTTIAAFYVLWEFFVQGAGRASGPLLNPNNMAALLNLSLLPVAAYAIGGKHRALAIAITLILFAALLATGSRGGLLCFIAGSFIIAIALYKPVMAAWKPTAGLVALLFAVFAGFYIFTHSILNTSLPILGDAAADYSSLERLAIWKGALALFQAHWLSGTGLGTFYLYYPAFRLDSDGASLGHWAHFDALQLGVETGVLAIVLFYAVMVAWVVRGVRGLIKLPTDDSRRVLIAGCLAGLVTLALHSHIEFQFYVMANLIVAAVLMAALYVLTAEPEEASFIKLDLATHDRFIWSGALIVAAILVSFTLLSSAAGIHYLNRANAAFNKADLDGFTKNIALSRRYSPRSFADADVQLAGLYVDLLIQQPGQMNDADRLTAYRDGLQLLDEAQMANPALADIDHKKAKLYSRIDDVNEPDHKALAIAAWTQALKKNPLHYHAREEFARYLIKQGKVEEAFNVLQDGLHRPMTAPARAMMTTLSAQLEPLVAVKRQHQNPQP